jgi:hypothetical protein
MKFKIYMNIYLTALHKNIYNLINIFCKKLVFLILKAVFLFPIIYYLKKKL